MLLINNVDRGSIPLEFIHINCDFSALL